MIILDRMIWHTFHIRLLRRVFAALALIAAILLAVAPAPARTEPGFVPALAFGVGTPRDYGTQRPFLDQMRSSRDWLGHSEAGWGTFSPADLRAGGYVNERGWPVAIPDGATALEALFLVDLTPEAVHLSGEYTVLYDGQGDLRVTGRATRIRPEPGRIRFNYTPGPGHTAVSLRATDPDDPIRNIRVVKTEHLPLLAAGEIFHPDWLSVISDVRSLRFMDWMLTNNSTLSAWEDRPRVADANWAERGVPHEVMIALANRIGVDPWFTLPHQATDAYMRNFAIAVRDGLDPRLKVYVEYSNEVWNWGFQQAGWAREQSEALWGPVGDGWVQYYALRATQMADIWAEVFGDAGADRLVRVISTQTGWLGLERAILDAPLAQETLGGPPSERFDAYAITGYFGYEWGGPEMADTLNAILDRSEAAARADGEARGLSRVALRDYVTRHRFDTAVPEATAQMRGGSMERLVDEIFPYHARVAREAGLDYIMYEGGNHIAVACPHRVVRFDC